MKKYYIALTIYSLLLNLGISQAAKDTVLIPKGTLISRSDTGEVYFKVIEDIHDGEVLFTLKKIKILKKGWDPSSKMHHSIYKGWSPIRCIHTTKGWLPSNCNKL